MTPQDITQTYTHKSEKDCKLLHDVQLVKMRESAMAVGREGGFGEGGYGE